MNMNKESICLKFVLLFAFTFNHQLSLFSQHSAEKLFSISGSVKDHNDQPVPFCHAYLSQTLNGVHSNSNGNFTITNLRPGFYRLVLSHVGYETAYLELEIRNEDLRDLNIKLRPSLEELDELTITVDADKEWEKNIKIFTKFFLGNGKFSDQCTIDNPWVLSFEKQGKELKAFANEPVKVRNEALGYLINVELIDFQIFDNQFKFNGFFHFDLINALARDTDVDEISYNRKQAYLGSVNHFLASLTTKNWENHGFTIWTRTKEQSEADQKTIVDTISFDHHYDLSDHQLGFALEMKTPMVFNDPKSNYDYSSITQLLPGQPLVFSAEGLIINPESTIISGHVATSGISEMLPVEEILNFHNEFILSKNQNDFHHLLKEYLESHEKDQFLYVRTNKSNYCPGETIMYRTFLLNDQKSIITGTLNKINVFLVKPDGTVVAHHRLNSLGQTDGHIQIPQGTENGKYLLRAYTNRSQRQFNAPAEFERVIHITNQRGITTDVAYNSKPGSHALLDPNYEVEVNSETIQIVMQSVPDSVVYVVAHDHSKIKYFRKLSGQNISKSISINKKHFKNASGYITLFGAEANVLFQHRYTEKLQSEKLFDILSLDQTLKMGDSISLAMHLFSDEFADVSVSVINNYYDNIKEDMNEYFNEADNIISRYDFRWWEQDNDFIDAEGITIAGNLSTINGKYYDEAKLHLINLSSGTLHTTIPDNQGEFRFENVIVNQDSKLSMKVETKETHLPIIVLYDDPSPDVIKWVQGHDNATIQESDLTEVWHNGQSEMINIADVVLPEIKIKGRKIYQNAKEPIFRKGDYSICPDSIPGGNDVANVLDLLVGRVPGLQMTTAPNGRKLYTIGTARTHKGIYGRFPLIILDNSPIFTSYGQLMNLDPKNIKSIEVAVGANARLYGTYGASSGVISIYTKSYSERMAKRDSFIKHFKIDHGFNTFKSLQHPEYNNINENSTLYWNPSMVLEGNKTSYISFQAPNHKTSITVDVQGVTASGKLISYRKVYRIE